MPLEKLVLIKRQCKDQVWYEAVSLQEYKQWEQTHVESPSSKEGGNNLRFTTENSS